MSTANGKTDATTEYIALGIDAGSDPDAPRYWVAGWSEGDGPTTPETMHEARESAEKVAGLLADARGVEAVEVDEFGPVAL